MALSTATRRPISSRTAPASRARTVRCTAQHSSSVSRHLLAAGAALAVTLGPSAAPAQAIWQYLPFGESIKNAIAQPTATEQTPITKAGDVVKNERLTLRDEPQTQPPFPASLLNAKADDDSGASTTPVSTPKLGANEQAPFGGDKSKVDSPAGSAADIRAKAAEPERPVRGAETPSLASPIAGQVDVELAAKTVEAENQPAPK